MRDESFSKSVEAVKLKLHDYLNEHGIDKPQYHFSCISPDHEDKNPSCSAENGTTFHCFSCSFSGDIFTAASIFEDKPESGKLWVHETLKYLCDKYEIPLTIDRLTEDDIYEIDTYKAYAAAADFISSKSNADYTRFSHEVDRRGWKHDKMEELKIGTVKCSELTAHLKSIGFPIKFLKEIDLTRKELFNTEHMIFTVCDEIGRPVGFAARNLVYKKDDKNSGTKYINQKTTGIKNNIYQKGKRLYNFHNAIKSTPPLYIFEGYADAITALHNGIENVCCVGGVAFTDDHITVLKERKQYNIILCFDADEAGQNRVAKLLDEKFSGHKDMKVRIITLPDGQDPDEFIRRKGAKEFYSLNKFDAFTWRLERHDDREDEPMDVCNRMIPLIINEPNYIERENMVNTLSSYTGISTRAINSELRRLDSANEQEAQTDKDIIIEKMVKDVRKNPADSHGILSAALNNIEEVNKNHSIDNFSQSTWVDMIRTTKDNEENLGDENPGFKLNRLKLLEEVLHGNWRQDVLMCFGGQANTGKTSLMASMALDLALSNDDVCVIFHTIDDSIAQFLPRLVCISGNDPELEINHVLYPGHYNQPHQRKLRDSGYEVVARLAHEGKLIVKDSSSGTTLSYGEGLIKHYQEKYPNKQIVYFLDNFHKLSDMISEKDERIRFKHMSNYIKNHLAIKYHIPVLATVEYTKLDPKLRPTNNNIAESVAMEYDSNLIVHMYNEMHGKGAEAVTMHRKTLNGEEKVLPRCEMIFGKNKITSFKDSMFLDFYPASSMFENIPIQQAMEERIEIMGSRTAARETGSMYRR